MSKVLSSDVKLRVLERVRVSGNFLNKTEHKLTLKPLKNYHENSFKKGYHDKRAQNILYRRGRDTAIYELYTASKLFILTRTIVNILYDHEAELAAMMHGTYSRRRAQNLLNDYAHALYYKTRPMEISESIRVRVYRYGID